MQIAHGHGKASGKPMVAILPNRVGLLHANMAVYYACIDRAPIVIAGAAGPMDETKRRPRIDWIHSAQTQGAAIRDYAKWDYQPTTVDGVPKAFARACSVMNFDKPYRQADTSLGTVTQFGMDTDVLRHALMTSSAANHTLALWGKQTIAWAADDMVIVQDMVARAGLSLPQSGLNRELCRALKPKRYQLDKYGR